MHQAAGGSIDAIAARHGLSTGSPLASHWNARLDEVLSSIDEVDRRPMPARLDLDRGITTIDNAFDFDETRRRLLEAITSQSDTTVFAEIDLAGRSAEHAVTLPPTTLILFGAPAPGGRCMKDAPRLGLDAFCQKLLVWEDDAGGVHASFNDLPMLAERQELDAGFVLRFVNRRVRETLVQSLSTDP